ncbi:MAG TPA: dTDP-4-dehydrorhamnose reductase [Caulobacteraceae bacterium]|jgi:dTDP-4-dehydrorhamnose reductase|nr:dTDP-4-dehydrorhamnose reductase [Caulobacteraceae bacterium]
MQVLVTGAGGQLASELVETTPPGARIVALSEIDLDITDAGAVADAVRDAAPDVVINAAAYTAVDRAETDKDLAWRVNRDGAAHLAQAAQARGVRFIHVSTDFVFDGRSGTPYRPEDPPAPLGVYGASKLAGETAVQEAAPDALIVRTAWVYSPFGGNFLKTMLRLMNDRGEVAVVADQIGTPTCAATLARTLWGLNAARARGLHHCTDAGAASWYDFAVAIAEEAQALGMLRKGVVVRPIATSDYPTPARRPPYSVLDKASTWAILGEPAPHWRSALRETLTRLKAMSR